MSHNGTARKQQSKSSSQHTGQVYNDKKLTASPRDDMAEELRQMSSDIEKLEGKDTDQQGGNWQAVDRSRDMGTCRPWHGIAYVGKGQVYHQTANGRACSGAGKGSSVDAEKGSV